MTDALLPKPKPKQGQPGIKPAGPLPSKKKPVDEFEPFVVPQKQAGGGKPGAMAGPGAAAGPGPAGNAQPLIKIDPDAGSVARPAANVDPYAFYLSYYRSRQEDRVSPDKLRQTLGALNRLRKFREAHAAILGYLKNNGKMSEPWMYEALALSIKMNNGQEADVKKSLNFAADLAQNTHNPNHLISIADRLYLEGYFERVGRLLDEAIPLIPHRSEPVEMSINLAQKTKDPVRMGDAVDRLLSLGWPGRDEYFRIESGNQVEQLVKQLRAENKSSEADILQKRLEESSSRDVFIRLTWDGYADYDLTVEEPLGITASYSMPRTVFGGALIKNGYGIHPEEIYVCPRAFNGKYTIRVTNIWSDPKRPVTRLTLEVITDEGTSREKKQTRSLKPEAANPPTVVTVTDGRRKQTLPYVDPALTNMETTIQSLKNTSAGKMKPVPAKDAKGRPIAAAPGPAAAKPGAPVPK